MVSKKDSQKEIIGRAESMDFVDYGILNIPAKTDTGAYRSSVHASSITLNDDNTLSFSLLEGHPACTQDIERITTARFSKITVTNSFGNSEERYEVKLRVRLGSKTLLASFSLADRKNNVYPILIGRRLLNHDFLVDPAKTGINKRKLKNQFGIELPLDEEEGKDT